ncbi:MAG TPA: SDR family NAD(P)-dependent oxidoreductase, partial [Arachnia sp.]|nr:SDR family NAD(P)-dependent oxidoreductase [Arachnia sp.]
MERRLEGRVALVTGASRGLGRAIALRLAVDGARVAVNYARSASGADEVVSLIRDRGGDAVAVQADVTDEKQAGRLVEVVSAHFGVDVGVIVNNAT